MDKVKTLPPLVYGKLSGVLEFFVDEVKITENFHFESNICDVIVQIQWWGETIPSYVRPLRISYFTKRNEPILDSKISLHSLTYEIKTNIELFKSYLRSTEVMELAVYDKIENAIIGSAFVKDLVSIIFNDKVVVIPIINYFGNQIGDIKIRLAFHRFDAGESKECSPKKMTYPSSEHLQHNLTETQIRTENLNELPQTISDNIQKQLHDLDISDTECSAKAMHYNTPVSCHHEKHFKTTKKLLASPKNLESGNKKSSPNHFPEKEIYDDSSKVLYFNINPAKKLQSQKKTVSKINMKPEALKPQKINKPTSKIGNKKISKEMLQAPKPVTIEFKAQEKNSPQKFKKKITKSNDQIKTFHNVSEKISQVNKIFLTPTKSTSQSDLEKIPVKEIKKQKKQPNTRVLDYLLGKEMSKKEECLALNEFKNMSPCQNMVSSITALCNENLTINEIKNCRNISSSDLSNKDKKIRVNGRLQFNLTDPVEKLYYKTFFSKENPELEVAELLNQPENKFILDRRKDKCPFKNTKKKSVNNLDHSNFNKKQCCDIVDKRKDIVIEKKNCESTCEFVKNCHDDIKPMNELQIGPNNCLRCKYYKKLGQLDKIIESLKLFENRMKTFEKKENPEIADECNIDFAERDNLFDSRSSVINLDLNVIEDDMQSISNEIRIERKGLLDDFNDDFESSMDDSDFIEFSDYLARSKRVV